MRDAGLLGIAGACRVAWSGLRWLSGAALLVPAAMLAVPSAAHAQVPANALPPPASASTPANAERLAPVQRLRIGNGNEPESLDPHRAEGVSSANIVRDLYEGLAGLSPDGRVVSAAAERWETSADGRRWTFHLRPDLRWSNGDALVAEDFAAGLRRSVAPATGSAYAQMLGPLTGAAAVLAGAAPPSALGVQATDARTLVVTLANPLPHLPSLLVHPSTFPIHGPSLARWGRDFAKPGRLVGNGAFTLAEWRPQSHVRLSRNPHYWNVAATTLAQVDYLTSEDVTAELARYRADELDVTSSVPLLRAPWLKANLGAELRVAPYLGSYYYGLNCARPPFAGNPKLRQALALAVDREVIVRKVMHGLALPAYGFVPPGIAGYTPQRPAWADWPRVRRLALARQLYAEAGYSAAKPLTVELRYNTNEDHRRIALVVAAMWRQWLGVRTTLVNEEFKVFIGNRNRRAVTQAFRSSWIADYDDPLSFAETLHSTHGQNDSAWTSPAYDALLAQAAVAADPVERRALLEAAERLVLDEVPVVPIYTYTSKHLVKPWVAGWQDNPLDVHYAKDLRVLAP